MPTEKKAKKRAKTGARTKTAAPAQRADAAYLISDIDPDLMARFKSRAAADGRQMKWLFHDFIQRYADGA